MVATPARIPFLVYYDRIAAAIVVTLGALVVLSFLIGQPNSVLAAEGTVALAMATGAVGGISILLPTPRRRPIHALLGALAAVIAYPLLMFVMKVVGGAGYMLPLNAGLLVLLGAASLFAGLGRARSMGRTWDALAAIVPFVILLAYYPLLMLLPVSERLVLQGLVLNAAIRLSVSAGCAALVVVCIDRQELGLIGSQ